MRDLIRTAVHENLKAHLLTFSARGNKDITLSSNVYSKGENVR